MNVGFACSASAAAPATCGVAADVPLNLPGPLPYETVLTLANAEMSGFVLAPVAEPPGPFVGPSELYGSCANPETFSAATVTAELTSARLLRLRALTMTTSGVTFGANISKSTGALPLTRWTAHP